MIRDRRALIIIGIVVGINGKVADESIVAAIITSVTSLAATDTTVTSLTTGNVAVNSFTVLIC